jgi:hypothetical protein
MSFTNGGDTKVFPLQWIKDCLATYTKDHGKAPQILVLNPDDLIDYRMNLSIHQADSLGLKIIYGDYLDKNEIDLAMGIKGEKNG